MVHTSSAGGLGLIPGLGTKIPHATQVVKKKKKKKANKNRLLWEKLWVYAQVDKGTASTIKPRWGVLREVWDTEKGSNDTDAVQHH